MHPFWKWHKSLEASHLFVQLLSEGVQSQCCSPNSHALQLIKEVYIAFQIDSLIGTIWGNPLFKTTIAMKILQETQERDCKGRIAIQILLDPVLRVLAINKMVVDCIQLSRVHSTCTHAWGCSQVILVIRFSWLHDSIYVALSMFA